MGKVIAVAGKGGTGKTTIACLSLRYLVKNGYRPVLALDADPNSNFGESLGINVERTIGDIREEFMRSPETLPAGMDKISYLHVLLNQVLIERDGFDLMVMGRQEGQGCYCMVNNVFRQFSEDLAKNYGYVIADNEAGMEHLSRRTNGRIDILLMVSDYSLRGLRAVKRIYELINTLGLHIETKGLVVNRAAKEMDATFLKEVEDMGLPLLATILEDETLMAFDRKRQSLIELPDTAPSVIGVNNMLDRLISK
ncbi:MAG: AAA family ATPase [Desulfobacterales bacterium]|nr:AAA family ATPase [Desulfobacterales bacterium]